MRSLALIVATLFSMGPSHLHVHPHGAPIMASPVSAKPAPLQPVVVKKRRRLSIPKLAGEYAGAVKRAALSAHVPPRLVAAVLHVENRGFINRCADRVSSEGAIGPMQLTPQTAWDTLRVNPWNPQQNIFGGARYLARLIRQFNGNILLALVAYNAGPTATAQGDAPSSAWHYAHAVMRYAQLSSAAS
ncbi:transglycosylase SLT domain-containing protein [Acidithiobacillus ferridurans]|uniref:Lytic transglycosylase domain-containing protein n=1 Tax=Acidithiobacillus ferridurans TaxID=1232575 RepID=A0A8X8G754_ACIFI|nr:transglycosylase SLT domain-containing protein [Acidithiobacillus ferridurans]MBU2715822.1 lytic transglycosylase domain-containing protein [Acidithiobacillus ferridurans]MBU2722819.1 lytic transglycosylase domain-containing protein [Acidithiobacillus ferridurans]MBU2727794.1 lytic transglycosylase domain-containing protein [Acidithiobacillus ferridurans]